MAIKEFANPPKQARSRASYEQVLEAATTLLSKKGYAGFTLRDVSRASGVSVGAIYGRFRTKDGLFRLIQARVLKAHSIEVRAFVEGLSAKRLELKVLVPAAVAELADFLRRHGRLISAFLERSPVDPVIARTGRSHYRDLHREFAELLLLRQHEIRHPQPARAIETCFRVCHSSLVRFLGLGADRDAVGEGDWDRLVEDLGHMVFSFLSTPIE